MNEEVQARLDRIDAALGQLIESITSYNPSPQGAQALVDADDDLAESLDVLATHQQRYAELEYLRRVETYLSSKVKASLQTLADTRRELLHSTSVTLPAAGARPVDYTVLLKYAQRIARQTKPHISQLDAVSQQEAQEDGKTAQDALSEEQKAYLSQTSELAFAPWPTLEVIRKSRHVGQEPAAVDEQPLDAATSQPVPTFQQPRRRSTVQQPDFDEFDLYDPTEA